MKKQYEIALSYAHKDKEIAEMIQVELENIFADGFFMDELRPEELTVAGKFTEQLQDIFHRSEYAIILYSGNYIEGTFTGVEMEAILQQEKEHMFIINVNDCKLPEPYTYSLLEVTNVGTEKRNVDADVYRQICNIIHNKIKKYIIKRSVEEQKMEKVHALNIQTIFTSGNEAHWKMDYDWNLLGKAYIGKDGRMIRPESSWQELWQEVEKEFLWIKDELEPDTMRRIRFNCHLSIAYKLGQIYGDLGQASGNRNLELVSSNRYSDMVFTLEKEIQYDTKNFDFYKEYDGNDPESKDFICIISIKPREQRDILETVKYYLKEQGQKYRKICLLQEKMAIDDANTLENIAEYLRIKMQQCSQDCGVHGGYTMHLFPDTTAPLMFALGARTIVPGKMTLYEYNPTPNSYEKSLTK